MNWAARTVRLTEKRPLGDLPETRSRECRYGQIAISKPRFIGLFPPTAPNDSQKTGEKRRYSD